MKKAAIYIRVSTDAQMEGYSVEAQQEALEAYCISKGLRNYELYIDGGFTGSNLERPAMQRLIADVKAGQISHVLVYKLDRLSRSQKDTLHLIEDILNPNDVSFVSLNESMDTGTPMGRLMLGILSAFAQLERENIRERTRMGMKERVKAGYWMGGGKVPFGYDYDAGQGILVPNKDAELVREMYRLYLKGYSPADIAQITGVRYDRLVTQILRRKTNIGIIRYKGEDYQGKHQPLISREIYDRTLLEMEQRSGKNIHSRINLLTGLVVCGHCGAKMRYQKWGDKGHKLVCYSRQGSKPYLVKDPDCMQEHVWADEVEEALVEDLFRFSAEKTLVPEEEEKNVVKVLEEQIEKQENKLRRLYKLYADEADEDGVLVLEISEIKDQIHKLKDKLYMEKERQSLSKNRAATLEKITGLSQVWSFMTPLERRTLINQVVDRIIITDQYISVEYKL